MNWMWGYGEKPIRLLLATVAGVVLFGAVQPIPRFLSVLEGAVGITVIGMLIASWTKKIMYR